MLTVKEVEYEGGHTLICLFSNGEKRRIDLTPLCAYPAYEALRDPKLFAQFGLDGTIFWTNGADIAPEYLFEHGTPTA